MKFELKLKQATVPEWKDAYLRYRKLQSLINPFKLIKYLFIKIKFSNDRQNIILNNARIQDLLKLKEFDETLQKLLFLEYQKINAFFQYKSIDCGRKWKYLNQNAQIIRQQLLSPNFSNLQKQLRVSYHLFWKEINLLQQYLQINEQGIDKLIQKHNKNMKIFSPQKQDLLQKKMKKIRSSSYLGRNASKFQDLIQEVRTSYLRFFYTKFHKSEGNKELDNLLKDQLLSTKQIFYFALFFGFVIIILSIIVYDLYTGKLSISNDDSQNLFMDLFPIFRGVFMFILYQWMLAFNVYGNLYYYYMIGWNRYNVNYKLIFKFNHHYSTLDQILGRAAIFTFVFLIIFVFFITFQNQNDENSKLNYIQGQYSPLIIWIVYLGYIFFPSYEYLNGNGRRYFYDLLKICVFSVFYKMEFRIAWATDQFVSFVGPLKDLEQTICYYTQNFYNKKETNELCFDNNNFIYGFIIAFIPLFFRMCQCARQGYDNGKFLDTPYFYNFGKYFCSVIVAVFSYTSHIYKNIPFLFNLWIIFAAISVIYSFYWDLKHDWGFLESESKFTILRKKLTYRTPMFYYTAMSVNLILRLTWVLSISPTVQNYFASGLNPQLYIFMISFLEMFRRCLWNFFRVEYEHVKNQTSLKAVEDLQYPIQPIQIDQRQIGLAEHEKSCLIDDDYMEQCDKKSQVKDSFRNSFSDQNDVEDRYQSVVRQSLKLLHLNQKYINMQYPSFGLVDQSRQFYFQILKQVKQEFIKEDCIKKTKIFKNMVEEYYNSQSVLEFDIESQRMRKKSNFINIDEQGEIKEGILNINMQ